MRPDGRMVLDLYNKKEGTPSSYEPEAPLPLNQYHNYVVPDIYDILLPSAGKVKFFTLMNRVFTIKARLA